MRAVSLFSGIGGFELGMDHAGVTTIAQAEKNKDATKILESRFPSVRRYTDVCEVGAEAGPADLVYGGWPCQDLSVAGKRVGLVGKRSGLFYEFARIVDEVSPRWVLAENVPGLLSSNDGRDMGIVLGTLAELGYGWAYRVLDAQYFGVPQRRRRVFIVGCLGDARSAAEVLFEPESCNGDPAPSRSQRQDASRTAGEGVAGTLGSKEGGNRTTDLDGNGAYVLEPDSYGFTCKDWGQDVSRDISPTLRGMVGAEPNGGGQVAVAFSENQRGEVVTTDIAHQLTTGGGKPGQGYPAVAFTASEQANGYAWETETYPTLNAQTPNDSSNIQYGIREGMIVRRLTPLECERLQGFPDNWTAELSDSARYRVLGNAVAVPVVEWIARRLVAVDAHLERASA